MNAYGAIVFAAGFALGVGLCVSLRPRLQFSGSREVVGWVTVNGYPKQQELLYFAGALVIIPLVSVGLWLVWMLWARLLARVLCQSHDTIRRRYALTFAPLVLVLARLWTPEPAHLFVLPLFLLLVANVFLLANDLFGTRIRKLADRSIRCPWQRARPVVDYLLIPVFLYAVNYRGPLNGPIDLYHEGERLAPLNALLQGAIPFRDVYIQHGLFADAWRPLLAAKLFGATVAADRLMGALLGPLTAATFYVFAIQVLGSRIGAFLLAWTLSSGLCSDFSPALGGRLAPAYLALAMVAIIVRDQLRPSERRAFILAGLSGIITFIAIINSLEIGLFTLVSCLVCLTLVGGSQASRAVGHAGASAFAPVLVFLAAAALAALPLAIYLGIQGALGDALRNATIQVRYQSDAWGLPFPELIPALRSVSSVETFKTFLLSRTFACYFPPVVYAITLTVLAFRLVNGRFAAEPSSMRLVLTVIAGVVFFRTLLGRSDRDHFYGLAFAWLLVAHFMVRRALSIGREIRHVIGGMDANLPVLAWHVVLFVFPLAYTLALADPTETLRRARLTFQSHGAAKPLLSHPIPRGGGIDVGELQAAEINSVVQYIQDNTGRTETIFDFSGRPAYYFLANRQSATRYFAVSYAVTETLQREVIQDLERHGTRLVLFAVGGMDGIPNTQRQRVIAEYLARNFVDSGGTENVRFLMRK